MKKAILASILLSAFAAPAMAGPYVSKETDIYGVGGDLGGTLIQGRVGYEYDELEKVTPYVEVGGGVLTPDGGDTEGVFAVEAGIGLELSEKVDAGLSVENLRIDGENNWLVEADVRYNF